MNRHERRAAAARAKHERDELAALARMNLDELFEDTKTRVRAAFERNSEIEGAFVCITETGKVFGLPIPWRDRQEKAASFGLLRDAFRARHVVRYVMASEVWMGSPDSGVRPSEDPNRKEAVQVLGSDRDGGRRWTMAEITRANGSVTLADWESDFEVPPSGWMLELIDTAASDVRPKVTPPEISRLDSEEEFHEMLDEHPDAKKGFMVTAALMEAFEKDLERGPASVRMAVGMVTFGLGEAILREEMGHERTAQLFKKFAAGLGSMPDMFPMFGEKVEPIPEEADRMREKMYAALKPFGDDDDRAVGESLFNFSVNVLAKQTGTFDLAWFLNKVADDLAAGRLGIEAQAKKQEGELQ
jgi:hypothetical protein